MTQPSLFLICPDCHLESRIRDNFGNNSYFLTALGAVFDLSQFIYAEEINQIILSDKISDIYLVNDTECTFINNVISKEINYRTSAEKILNQLYQKHNSSFSNLPLFKQQKRLAELSINNQANNFLDVAFIGNKIKNGEINIKGLILDRTTDCFDPVVIDLITKKKSWHH